MVSSDVWDAASAARYDDAHSSMFAADVVGPTVDVLAELAGDGRALELAIGTGRIAVPLHERGVEVAGIELSEPMVERLRTKASADEIPVVVGDMSSERVDGEFALVYLVFNTIGNLRTQDEQVACFANAARHLAPGGRFVVEVGIPSLRLLPPTSPAIPFDVSDTHVGFDTYDLVTQRAVSHHLTQEADGRYRRGTHNFRYVWPSELDLMGRLAGLTLEHRWADWDRSEFTSEATKHVSVWRKA